MPPLLQSLGLLAALGWAVARHGRCPLEPDHPDHRYNDRGDGVCCVCGAQRCTYCAHGGPCREHDRPR